MAFHQTTVTILGEEEDFSFEAELLVRISPGTKGMLGRMHSAPSDLDYYGEAADVEVEDIIGVTITSQKTEFELEEWEKLHEGFNIMDYITPSDLAEAVGSSV